MHAAGTGGLPILGQLSLTRVRHICPHAHIQEGFQRLVLQLGNIASGQQLQALLPDLDALHHWHHLVSLDQPVHGLQEAQNSARHAEYIAPREGRVERQMPPKQ